VTFVTPGGPGRRPRIAQDFRGANNYRPNVVCDPTIDNPTITAISARRASSLPTDLSQPFGNAPRNSVRARSSARRVTDQADCLRQDSERRSPARAFNVPTNFFAPSGNRSTGAFGTITGTYDARQLQFGVKVNW
jgi:hypothetical protein